MKQASWTIGTTEITSYGNGLAYAVKDTQTGLEFFLQGDDAAAWREGYDAADERDTVPAYLSQSFSDYSNG